jgi:ribosomal-protein-alanine N-acetyltransferase
MTFGGPENLKSELENSNSRCLIAKQDNTIVGFASVWKAFDEIHITNIVVKKDFRRTGIGKLLLEKLIQIYKNLTLEVMHTNIPAISLYSKYGFKKVGIRKNYYKGTHDALIMTLNK